jgi:methyl-accepting chemotaxis protein
MKFISLISQNAGNGEFWSLFTYTLIGVFFGLACILGVIQLLKRLSYKPGLLRDRVKDYAKNSGITDEAMLFNYVNDYFSSKFLSFDEIIRFLITSLIILGLLGTFVGLATLIVPNFNELTSTFNSGNNSGKSFEDVLSQITGGFKTAFYTSIVSIIAALLSSFFYQFYRHNIKVLRITFINLYMPAIIRDTKVDNVAYDPVALYKEIERYFIDGLKEFKEEVLKNQIELKNWADTVITSNTNMVKDYIEANNEKTEVLISELKKENTNLNNVVNDNLKISEILDSVVGKLDSYADVIKNYDKTYNKLFNQIEEFSQKFGNLVSEINTIVDKTSQPSTLMSNLNNSITQMVNNQNDILDSNKAFFKEVYTKLENLIKNSDSSNQQLSQEINTSLSQFIDYVKETLSSENIVEMISPQTEKLTRSLTEIREIVELMGLAFTADNYTKIDEGLKEITKSVTSLSVISGDVQTMSDQLGKMNRNIKKAYENLVEMSNG